MRKAAEEWLRSAQDDLETIAEVVDNPRLTNIVAFHGQQCIEKCFKAVLEEREKEIPAIHNLITLLGRLEVEAIESINEDVLERLNQLYIEARYPGERGLLPEGKPSTEEAQHFHRFVKNVYERIRNTLQSDDR